MHNTRVLGNNQLFVIELLDREKFELKRAVAKVVGWEMARPLLGPVTKAIIRWVGDKSVAKPADALHGRRRRRRLSSFLQPPSSLASVLGLNGPESQEAATAREASSEDGELGVIGMEEQELFGGGPRKFYGETHTSGFSSSPDDECVTVRRTRSRSFVGQFETQLVLRKCPSDETIQAAFSGRSRVHNFNNLSAEALLTATSNLHDFVGVPDPFPPGSAPQGPKNGQTGLIERVGGIPPPGFTASKSRRLQSKEDALSRSRKISTSSRRSGTGTVVFDKAFYDMKERSERASEQTEYFQKSSKGGSSSGGSNERGDERKKDALGDFVFTLERTRSFGTPYAPGTTIGKIPSWFYND